MKTMIKFCKRGFLFMFIVTMLVLLPSCSYLDYFSLTPTESPQTPTGNPENPEDGPNKGIFTLAMYTGEKLNPYTSANRANVNIIRLCYDGLVTLDDSGSAVPLLAEYEINENTIVFRLKQNALFSDRSRITAADCVYSYNRAAKEDSTYKSIFENYIQSWKALDQYSFQVVLKKKNQYHINLFHIPIIKTNSDSQNYPVGSGRYQITLNEQNEECLSATNNPLYGGSFEISQIKLLRLSNAQDINYNFNYGIIHCAYADLSDGISRYKGNVELVSFPASSFVFAVVNGKKDYLKDYSVSKAISYAINRKQISKDLFDDLCDPVWYPFNPNWIRISAAQLNEDIYSVTEADSLLSAAGLKLSGGVRKWKGSDINLSIICNNEDLTKVEVAKRLAADLEALGFQTTLTQYNWNYYEEAIAKGDYDIYIGKVVVPYNMDITFMLNADICNNYRSYSWDFLSSLDAFYNDEIDVRSFVPKFLDEMPFIPLYFTKGALAVNRVVSGDFNPSEEDIFHGIENWVFEQ